MDEQKPLDAYGPSKDKKSGRGKRGALSTGEADYIRKNAEFKTAKEMAKEIGKGVDTVRKFIYKENLNSKENEHEDNQDVKARGVLRSRDYWPEIKAQFSGPEIKVFENIWVKLFNQFQGDVLASEELQMKKYISLEILKDRYSKKAFQLSNECEKLKKLIDEQHGLPAEKKNPEALRSLYSSLEKLEGSQLEFLKEYREFTDRQKATEKDLKMSRDDRIKNVLDATQNYTSAIKLLNENAEVRDQLGRHLEIMRAAKDNQKILMYSLHTYIDKNVDRPILNNESIDYYIEGEDND